VRLFGSRPGGGFPTDPTDVGPVPQFVFVPVHEGGRVAEVPFGTRSEGRGESEQMCQHRITSISGNSATRTITAWGAATASIPMALDVVFCTLLKGRRL